MLVTTSGSNSEASDTKKTTRISWDNHKDKPSFFIIILISELVLADIRYTLYITD
jgi:hypothetical protein